ncbi:MAG TPA: metallophosphoesterase [Verrucomicrobiota bacterium]|nr:metallophosphoesterase [Verrucomicrobiota bacterium]
MSNRGPSRYAEETVNVTLSRRSWLGHVAGGAALLLSSEPGAPSVVAAEQLATEATATLGRFLVISDFHLDPFLGLSRDQFMTLAAAPIAHWPQLLAGQPAPQYGTDSPLALVLSSLSDAKSRVPDPDFILLPGDFLAHGWPQKYDRLAPVSHSQDPTAYHEFTTRVMTLVAARIREAFPRARVVPVLGNDDSYCGDYMIAPQSPFLQMFAEVWEPLVFDSGNNGEQVGSQRGRNSETALVSRRKFRETASRGGYYSIRLPGLSRHRLIALNTVFFAPQYSNACGDPTATPALDEFRWLEEMLAAAERDGESIWLLMHIPPGIDGFGTHRAGSPQPLWQPELTARFLQLVKRYEKTIQQAIAGHTHMDDFRLVRLDGRNVLLTKIVPAVSPIFGNNPGYQSFQYDRRDGRLINYGTYGLTLPVGPGAFAWQDEYEFTTAYPNLSLTAPSVAGLGAQILNGGSDQKSFTRYYSVSGPPTPVSSQILGCALLNTTVGEFVQCSAGVAGEK